MGVPWGVVSWSPWVFYGFTKGATSVIAPASLMQSTGNKLAVGSNHAITYRKFTGTDWKLLPVPAALPASKMLPFTGARRTPRYPYDLKETSSSLIFQLYISTYCMLRVGRCALSAIRIYDTGRVIGRFADSVRSNPFHSARFAKPGQQSSPRGRPSCCLLARARTRPTVSLRCPEARHGQDYGVSMQVLRSRLTMQNTGHQPAAVW